MFQHGVAHYPFDSEVFNPGFSFRWPMFHNHAFAGHPYRCSYWCGRTRSDDVGPSQMWCTSCISRSRSENRATHSLTQHHCLCIDIVNAKMHRVKRTLTSPKPHADLSWQHKGSIEFVCAAKYCQTTGHSRRIERGAVGPDCVMVGQTGGQVSG